MLVPLMSHIDEAAIDGVESLMLTQQWDGGLLHHRLEPCPVRGGDFTVGSAPGDGRVCSWPSLSARAR